MVKKYILQCFICESDSHLMLFPHRNEKGNVVGLIYSCDHCYPEVSGKDIEIKILNKVNVKQSRMEDLK